MTAQFKFFIIILAALLPGMADAAIVRGRVTDADGEGIGYAIVSVNETDSRCRADGDGYYSLTVPEDMDGCCVCHRL